MVPNGNKNVSCANDAASGPLDSVCHLFTMGFAVNDAVGTGASVQLRDKYANWLKPAHACSIRIPSAGPDYQVMARLP